MRNARNLIGGTGAGICLAIVCVAIAQAQTTERVSVDTGGLEANGDSANPAISADGRYVAFSSLASNLVLNDSNGSRDIFVHDLTTGITERVSVDAAGAQANGNSNNPAVSADGRYVAFNSVASNLVADDTNGVSDIFVHDRHTGLIEIVSVNSYGVQGNGESYGEPSISADGRFVAFSSFASNLVPGDTDVPPDVFVHDRATGVTEQINLDSVLPDGAEAGWENPSLSATGRYVLLVAGFTDDEAELLFVYDRDTGISEVIVATDFDTTETSILYGEPTISADGRYVASWSFGTSQFPPPGDDDFVPFSVLAVYDRGSEVLERISVDPGSYKHYFEAAGPAISADGRYVAFWSDTDGLVPEDENDSRDVFVFDRATGLNELVSVDATGNAANADSNDSAISAGGRYVAFQSLASNLVADDTNALSDIFVRDRGLKIPVEQLISAVENYELPQGIENALLVQLRNIRTALEADNAAGRQDAAKKLTAFIAFVEAQRGKVLTDEQANQLVAVAEDILAEFQSSDTG